MIKNLSQLEEERFLLKKKYNFDYIFTRFKNEISMILRGVSN